MQVVHIVPGSGGSFYCGNCLRDNTYVIALRKAGMQVVKVPMYLPLFADEHDLEEIPVFYGAVSLYLKHVFPALRRAPRWFDTLLNSGPVLKLAAKMSGSTSAHGLEDMTISMLLGEEGEQKEELDELVDWIGKHCRPDVIHLSNALLLGLARRCNEKLNAIVVCSLQDEDVWVNAMDDSFRQKTWKLMSEKAKFVDAFVAVSHSYAAKLKTLMTIPENKLFIQYNGIDPFNYQVTPPGEKEKVIGFISRMCHDNGLHILIEAFIQLKKENDMKDLKLMVTGGSTGVDSQYLHRIRERIKNTGVQNDVIFQRNFEEDGRNEFFRNVSVVSVPVVGGEAFGLYLLESMAAGVPVVQPVLGAFPEIITLAGGGITYQPNDPETLATSLAGLLRDPEQLQKLSDAGRQGVERHFNIHDQAVNIMKIYREVRGEKLSQQNASTGS